MRTDELRERLRLTLVLGRAQAAPRSILEVAEEAFAGGVTALQLREKDLPGGEFYRQALQVGAFCRERGKLFIINDRLDLALAVNADGLHLGQSDLPAEAAARLLPPGKILGISAARETLARQALQAGAAYLGVGAIFPTGSKDDADLAQRDQVERIIALGAPAVAIGGITPANAAEVWRLGFDGLAVISALTGAEKPAAAARALLAAREAGPAQLGSD